MNERKIEIIALDSVDSTNTYLRALAEKGAPEGTAVTAREQSAGRGRHGKSFYSPPSTGLYMSILTRPSLDIGQSHFMTSMTAVAVCRAIESIAEKDCRIKWVNDICIDGKKVSGILSEGSFDYQNNKTEYIVVGIGINIDTPEGGFPEEIAGIASSLEVKMSPERLANAVISEFFALYDTLPSMEYLDEYRSRSCIIGERIEVLGETPFTARAVGIDSDCRLIVETDKGEQIALNSGEVSTKIAR